MIAVAEESRTAVGLSRAGGKDGSSGLMIQNFPDDLFLAFQK
jgi:hypothetical protein